MMSIIGNYAKAKRLVGKPNSSLYLMTQVLHIPLPVDYLADINGTMMLLLKEELEIYSPELDGVPVAFNEKSAMMLESSGSMVSAQPYTYCNLQSEFVVFKPRVGDLLNGVVNKVTTNLFGCLIHNCFYATIHRKPNESKGISKIKVEKKIRLRVTKLEEDGNGVLSITGEISGQQPRQRESSVHPVETKRDASVINPGIEPTASDVSSQKKSIRSPGIVNSDEDADQSDHNASQSDFTLTSTNTPSPNKVYHDSESIKPTTQTTCYTVNSRAAEPCISIDGTTTTASEDIVTGEKRKKHKKKEKKAEELKSEQDRDEMTLTAATALNISAAEPFISNDGTTSTASEDIVTGEKRKKHKKKKEKKVEKLKSEQDRGEMSQTAATALIISAAEPFISNDGTTSTASKDIVTGEKRKKHKKKKEKKAEKVKSGQDRDEMSQTAATALNISAAEPFISNDGTTSTASKDIVTGEKRKKHKKKKKKKAEKLKSEQDGDEMSQTAATALNISTAEPFISTDGTTTTASEDIVMGEKTTTASEDIVMGEKTTTASEDIVMGEKRKKHKKKDKKEKKAEKLKSEKDRDEIGQTAPTTLNNTVNNHENIIPINSCAEESETTVTNPEDEFSDNLFSPRKKESIRKKPQTPNLNGGQVNGTAKEPMPKPEKKLSKKRRRDAKSDGIASPPAKKVMHEDISKVLPEGLMPSAASLSAPNSSTATEVSVHHERQALFHLQRLGINLPLSALKSGILSPQKSASAISKSNLSKKEGEAESKKKLKNQARSNITSLESIATSTPLLSSDKSTENNTHSSENAFSYLRNEDTKAKTKKIKKAKKKERIKSKAATKDLNSNSERFVPNDAMNSESLLSGQIKALESPSQSSLLDSGVDTTSSEPRKRKKQKRSKEKKSKRAKQEGVTGLCHRIV